MARGEPADGETQDMLPARGIQSPPTLHRVNRRPFGIGPVPLLGGVLAGVLILAIVLLAVGAWVAGVVLLALSLGCLALLLVAVEYEPDDPAARRAVTAADRARSHTKLVAVAARAGSAAGLAVVRLSQRRLRLRRQLKAQLEPIGEAAYLGDEDRVEILRARAKAVEQELEQTEREKALAVQAARDEVERERAVSQPTQSLPVQAPREL